MGEIFPTDVIIQFGKIDQELSKLSARIADLERMTKTLNDSIAALSKPDPVAAAHDRLERAAFDVLVELDKIKSGS